MKTLVGFWAVAITFVCACLFWRNWKRYRKKSWFWIGSKSAFECLILFLTAAVMPALLVVWLVLWITKPIKKPWARTVVGVISGVILSVCSSFMLELLVFLGIWAIDQKSGTHTGGFLQCWKRAEEEAVQAPAIP